MSGLTTAWVAREMRKRGYFVAEGPDAPIEGGAADSRRVRTGDLFTAFPGEQTDGNLYVADALRNGAVAAICATPPAGEWPDKTIIIAPDPTLAVGQLAQAWRAACATRVVGITGTVGKTTAKELTAASLATNFNTHRSEGNFNSREGLPLALLSLRTEHEVSVLEMGMDSRGEIRRLCEIAEPEVGVVLNIGLTHVSKLGSAEAIAEEKLSLPRYLGSGQTAVLNADDPWIAAAIPSLACRVISFGSADGANLRAGPVTNLGLDGTRFAVCFEGRRAEVRSRMPGAHLVPAALAAIGCALALGMTVAEASEAVSNAEAPGRIQRRTSDTGAVILDDRYNSSPASLAGALDLLGSLPGRRFALLGKMAELGDFEVTEHEKAGRLAARSCDLLFVFGETARPLAEAARATGGSDVRWFADKDAAAAELRALLREGDVVLVKGSRSEALESVIPLLEGTR